VLIEGNCPMNTSRPRRTNIAGARAQFASASADVLNVSSTGVLVRTTQPQTPGSQWPLTLDVQDTTLQFTARVVRCEPIAGPLHASTGRFALALVFVNPPAAAQTRLDQLCRAAHRASADSRRLKLTLTRRCPKCRSHDVAKEGRRHYSCCQCGQVFTGFRLGFLRFAR
jgi:hypothetical protein